MQFFKRNINLNVNKLIFLIILLISFISAISFRTDHYQELDSRLPYNLFEYDPSRAAKYISGTFLNDDFSDPLIKLSGILRVTPDSMLVALKGQPFFESAVLVYNKGSPYPESSEEIRIFIDKVLALRPHIANISAHGVYRIFLSNLVNSIGLNTLAARTLDFPLASTYSLGMGVIYAGTYGLTDSYTSFFSVSTFITQLLAHLSVFLLFFTLLNLHLPVFYAALASLFSLFSISLYSYGFHLGSTVYALFAFSLFFWTTTILPNNDRYFSRLGLIGGLLIFLNTLMAIPIAGVMSVHFAYIFIHNNGDAKTIKKYTSSLWLFIKKQRAGILLTSIFLLLFYQPGQGIRGEMIDLSEVFLYAYYSFLNLTGWFNDLGETINIMQICFFSSCLFLGIYFVTMKKFSLAFKTDSFYPILLATIVVYLVLLMLSLLNFSPTRQILFLQVFITYFYGFGLLFLLKKIKVFNKKGFQYLVLCIIGVLGLYGQQTRFEQMIDPFESSLLPKDVNFAIAPYADGFKNILDITVSPANSFVFKDTNGARTLYLSQTISFSEWIDQAGLTEAQMNSIINVETIKKAPGENSFIPYIPEAINDGRFSLNRRNGLYISVFQISTLANSEK